MEERRRPDSRSRKRALLKRRRRRNLIIKMTVFVVLIVSVIVGALLIKKFKPSKQEADLNEYYGIQKENQLAVIIDESVLGAHGIVIDGNAYVEYSVVRDFLNERFYVDHNENLLLYTLPEGTISAEVGSKEYSLQKENNSANYVILKMEGSTAYIALDFVKQYTNMDYRTYENPNRVIIERADERTVAEVKKAAKIRTEMDIKSDILASVSKKDKLVVLETTEKWSKVRTMDGYIGYIKKNCLKTEEKEVISRAFEEQIYPSISKDYTINLAWHVVSNNAANQTILETIAKTKGLTTLSPTWFVVNDTKGNIISYASSQYVNYAHQSNIEVWALVKDFDGGIDSDEETLELLSYTSRREKLINQLMAEALKTGIDGINVDFENISTECGEHYIQFLRELSLKCRQNNIVLSVDNPVPSNYSEQYHLEEQGKIADYVIVMGYDEHYKGSYMSGSVASPAFVEAGIQDALELVPKDKLINAVPFYTRLWKEVPKTQEELDAQQGTEAAQYAMNVTSVVYGMSGAQQVVQNSGAEIVVDELTGQNYAQWEADGGTYKIWLEDKAALETKLKLMKQYELAGTAAWRLGLEQADTWELILKYVN